MDNLFLTKNKDPRLDVFKQARKKSIDWIPINGDFGTWQADLMFMDNYTKYNSGFSSFLVLVEVPSRFCVVYPLKKKSDTFNAFVKFIEKYKPKLIISDRGSEFVNNKLQDLFSENNIKLYDTSVKTEVGIVERMNRTLRSLIERYIQLTGSYSYIDKLDTILKQYNEKIHSTTGHEPIEMHNNLDLQGEFIFNRNQKIKDIKDKINEQYQPGMKVRILINKALFDKGSIPKYSSEVYTIEKVEPPYLSVKNVKGEKKIHIRYVKQTSGEDLPKPEFSRKTLTREKLINQVQKRESIDEKNIIEGKRIRKPNLNFL